MCFWMTFNSCFQMTMISNNFTENLDDMLPIDYSIGTINCLRIFVGTNSLASGEAHTENEKSGYALPREL